MFSRSDLVILGRMLTLLSLIIVAFGQPVWSSWLGATAAVFGYTLFFADLLRYERRLHRFYLGVLFGTIVQMVQLSWLVSHPYWYIYLVHFAMSFLFGLQIGLVSILIEKRNVERWRGILGIASVWTLMEWSRLFPLAGFSFNPAGLALTGNIYSLQMASLWGAFGLTFWVLLVNLGVLRFWILRRGVVFALLACLPYIYGFLQINYIKSVDREPFPLVLVQTAFPAEEAFGFETRGEMVDYVVGEWRQIFTNLKEHFGKRVELVVLPEAAVPFGTWSFVFDHDKIVAMLKEIYGEGVPVPTGMPWVYNNSVNNAFLSQTMANLFRAGVVIGLEDASDVGDVRHYYSAAQYFQPEARPERYEKRVLVPMGEYIPFKCLSDLCLSYGVLGSLTPGSGAKLMHRGETGFGITICYEETFGNMMRENRQLGADLLVNITSDVWYPNSNLPQFHFDHAKLRTVEMGIPLARACNTGVTGVVDCFGRNFAILEGEWLSKALYVDVPMRSFQTLYSRVGDAFIIGLCLIFSLLFIDLKRRRR